MAPSRPPARSHAAYQRRNARARAAGYRSYYDYRVHDNGRIPASQPGLPVGQRSRARGHRGKEDFLRSIRPGTLVSLLDPADSLLWDYRKSSTVYRQRKFKVIRKLTVSPEGLERTWTLRNLTRAGLIRLIRDEERRGAVFSFSPSLDQRSLEIGS